MKDILILEDGQQERERLDGLFSSAGYSVKSCFSVAQAEQCVQAEQFRVAILDIGLGDKSGSYFFSEIKKNGRVSFVVIFTGNPSVHLKDRFLSEGAVDYIVKGSMQAQSENMLGRIQEIIGKPQQKVASGIPLENFLNSYVADKSRALFLDIDNSFPACKGCGSKEYMVEFSSQAQVPPEVKGRVVCAVCGRLMDLEVV